MWPFDSLKVRSKLALLVGVPVLGAMLLSGFIALDARQRAASAAALGSITDLADLSGRMNRVVQALQHERAETALSVGARDADTAKPHPAALSTARAEADRAITELDAFLGARDVQKLPTRLRRDLESARRTLAGLQTTRDASAAEDVQLEELLHFYAKANQSLIGATAALTQLSDDGQLLRTISTLVATMELIERASREHSLLSYTFARNEFPPGTFRYFVTLMTEEEVYLAGLRNSASDEDYRAVSAALKGPWAAETERMRQIALNTSDEEFGVAPAAWFEAQANKLSRLRKVERRIAETVQAAAIAKIAQTRRVVRTGLGLAGAVLLISMLLGLAISRRLTQSVSDLANAATEVQRTRDYSIRAKKTSRDEVGMLSEAFNEMLAGIQKRDQELEAHRVNLEKLVGERTHALSVRNSQMRLVLDNVQQGLIMLDRSGHPNKECSAAFARWFGPPDSDQHFATTLGRDQANTRGFLQLGYDQLMEGILPPEVALHQMPQQVAYGDSLYALSFTPVEHDNQLDGALLVVRDVTSEVAAQHAERQQRQRLMIVERLLRDRAGFAEFIAECSTLMERIRDDRFAEPSEKLRVIHTLKGSTAIFDVDSVSSAAHDLEQALLENDNDCVASSRQALQRAWDELVDHIGPLLDTSSSQRWEISKDELEQILAATRARVPLTRIEQLLVRLQHEPVRERFERIEQQLRRLAKRFGKDEPEVVIRAGDVRLPDQRFQQFWSNFAHVVRNVADHALETPAERLCSGKPARTRVELSAHGNRHALTIEIADDGRGIDWEKIRQKAQSRNLPCSTAEDLVQALLAPGISTADHATSTSGRGIGMSAVAEACRALQGTLTVESELGRWTRMRFHFPPLDSDCSLPPAPPDSSMMSRAATQA